MRSPALALFWFALTFPMLAGGWEVAIGGPAGGTDRARSVAVDHRGDVFAGGWLSFPDPAPGAHNPDFAVLKLEGRNGQEIWRVTVDGPGGARDQSDAVAIHPSGDVIAAGFLCGDDRAAPSGCFGGSGLFTMLRLANESGEEVWRTVLPSIATASVRRASGAAASSAPAGEVASRLVLDSRGDALAACNPRCIGDTISVVKIAGETGEVLWVWGFGNGGAYTIAVDANDDAILAGFVFPPGDPNSEFMVAKLSGATGAVLWRFSIPTPLDGFGDGAESVVVGESGDAFVLGIVNDPVFGRTDVALRLDGESGDLVWRTDRVRGGVISASERPLAMDPGGSLFLGASYGLAKLRGGDGGIEWGVPELLDQVFVRALAPDASGDVFLAGDADASDAFFLGRFSGGAGASLWSVEAFSDSGRAEAVAVDRAGNPVAAGNTRNPARNRDFAVVKKSGRNGFDWQAIDIRPRVRGPRIDPFSRALLPVALLGSESFDASGVDVDTLAFGPEGAAPARRPRPRLVDVNRDGYEDLLAYFRPREAGIAFGDAEACLSGEGQGDIPFEGCDSIRTLPACGIGFELALLLPPLLRLRRRYRRPPRS